MTALERIAQILAGEGVEPDGPDYDTAAEILAVLAHSGSGAPAAAGEREPSGATTGAGDRKSPEYDGNSTALRLPEAELWDRFEGWWEEADSDRTTPLPPFEIFKAGWRAAALRARSAGTATNAGFPGKYLP